jgi:hypothetical protein
MGEGERDEPVTSYAKRIERLERQYDALSGVVNIMAVDVAVTREKIVGIDGGINSLKVQITDFIAFSQKAAVDPTATGAGQLLASQIAAIKTAKDDDHTAFAKGIEDTRKSVARIDLKIAYGTGVLAALVLLFNLFAPTIQKVLGLPS